MGFLGGRADSRGLLHRLLHDEELCSNCILVFLGIMLLALVICLAAEGREAFGAAASVPGNARVEAAQPFVGEPHSDRLSD